MSRGVTSWVTIGVLFASACVTTHAIDDASGPSDAGSDAAHDAPSPPPDGGECGTLGLVCASDADCTEGLTCVTEFGTDAGVSGICIPPSRGSCGGWTGDPCATPTDLCVGSRFVTDIEFCFEPTQFRCLCGWPAFADAYDGCGSL